MRYAISDEDKKLAILAYSDGDKGICLDITKIKSSIITLDGIQNLVYLEDDIIQKEMISIIRNWKDKGGEKYWKYE